MKHLLAILCAAALAACTATATTTPASTTVTTTTGTTTPPPPSPNPLGDLGNFTIADLQAALADANAQTPPDVTSAQCYQYLIGALPTFQQAGAQPATVGAFVIFQKARDLAHGVGNVVGGQMTALNLACAPLVTDVKFTIAKLAAIGVGSAATAGAILPVPLVPMP